jgi:hypothetical protein
MRKKLPRGTHEEVIKCLREGIDEILYVFFYYHKSIPYREFKELKRIYDTLIGLIDIEIKEQRKELLKSQKTVQCTA